MACRRKSRPNWTRRSTVSHRKTGSAVVLHFLENHTFRSIAQKHGGTERAWQKRGAWALEILSGILRRRGVVATGTTLGAWLTASPAEAAMPASAIKLMLNEALRQPLAAGASTQTSTALLMIMKLKSTLAICFVIGAALSFGLSERSARSVRHSQQEITRSALPTRTDRSLGAEPVFNLERIASAISQYDSQDQADPFAESRLRALMFSVPEESLDSVHRLFGEIENPGRFGEIAACFFFRWAEIDPETAWLAALSEETYLQSACRGVLLTWLNKYQEAALAAMMENRSDEEDLPVLHEFAMMKVQHDPAAAAHLVDIRAVIFDLDQTLLDRNVLLSAFLLWQTSGMLKPDPGIFRMGCSELGVTPEEAVYIGDNPTADIKGAQEAGLKAVFVTTDLNPTCDHADATCSNLTRISHKRASTAG